MGFARDQRGAVLVMAAFMACFLAGCIWFLIGIADAIAFREKTQATADAVAFSSAAIHARGMNLICALNLVLVAIVGVYVVLRYVMLLCRAVLKVIGIPPEATVSEELDAPERLNTCLLRIDPSGTICKVARGVWRAHENVHHVAIPRYHEDVMKDGVKTIHDAETVIAAVTAVLAEVGSFSIAQDRGQFGVSFSPSLLPDEPWIRKLVEEPGSEHDEPAKNEDKALGLPVASEKIGVLCHREREWAFAKSKAWLGPIWDIFGPSEMEAKVKWCNGSELDGFFTKADGPMKVFARAHNGSEWTQVFGVVLATLPADQAAQRVRLADGDALRSPETLRRQRRKLVLPPAPEEGKMVPYVAQAELYYDCDDEWHGASCNGGTFGAMFAMRWRARLVRVRGPALLRRLQDASGGDVVSNLQRDMPEIAQSDDRGKAIAQSIAGPLLGKALRELAAKLELIDPRALEGDRWLH